MRDGRDGEQGCEVLGPAFAQLRKGSIHMGADGVPAVAEENLGPDCLMARASATSSRRPFLMAA